MVGLRAPRSRVRLDWLHVKDNILADGTDVSSNQKLTAVIQNICEVMLWEYGEAQS